jgi:hypothetical protein
MPRALACVLQRTHRLPLGSQTVFVVWPLLGPIEERITPSATESFLLLNRKGRSMFYIKKLGLLAVMAGVLMGVSVFGISAQGQTDRDRTRTQQRDNRRDSDQSRRHRTYRRTSRYTNRGHHYGQYGTNTWSNGPYRRHRRTTTYTNRRYRSRRTQ